MKRRVVITGTGVISPLGNDVETLWSNIKNGKSGIKPLESEDYKDLDVRIAGYIDDFNPEQYLDKKEINRYDRFAQFALAAAMQALEQSESWPMGTNFILLPLPTYPGILKTVPFILMGWKRLMPDSFQSTAFLNVRAP